MQFRTLLVLLFCTSTTYAGELQPVRLPAPETDTGKPLMQVLKERKSTREFSTESLSNQVLSNLAWAAFGVNRSDGRRTAPSTMNFQEIDVYVATDKAVYLYAAKEHTLIPILMEDIRLATGSQPFVRDAPVELIYVADFSKMGQLPEDQKIFYSATDTGFISQNVYLYCASEGLATVVRAGADRAALSKTMKLRTDQRIVLVQSVGYPKKTAH